MSTNNQLKALAAAVLLVLASGAGFAGTVAAQSGNTTQSAGNVAIGIEQAGNYEVTVTVTDDGTGVEGATVDVTSDSTYAGTGSYQTGTDGTVTLPAPAEPTTVTVTATKGDLNAETTAELEARSFMNFGQRVSYFVHGLLDGTDSEGGIGQYVSEFVKKNNPSNDNKPDHAGKPADAGKPENAGQSNAKDKGNADRAGEKDKRDTGKPAHANGNDATDATDTSDDEQDDEETAETTKDGKRGNGPDRGDNPGNGNGKR